MNDLKEVIILIGGIYNLVFAIFHLFFWRLFQWKKDLSMLTFINRSVMQILNLCLTFVFLLMAYISFFYVSELRQTNLGKTLLIGFSLFWLLRMIEQVIFFGMRNLISIVLTIIFLLGSVIYLIPFM